MHQFPVLIYIGGLILGWAAGSMVGADEYLALSKDTALYVKIALTLLTVLGGIVWKRMTIPKKIRACQIVWAGGCLVLTRYRKLDIIFKSGNGAWRSLVARLVRD